DGDRDRRYRESFAAERHVGGEVHVLNCAHAPPCFSPRVSRVIDCSAMRTPPLSLLREIGRWSLTAGVINCVIGSGVFGLPSALANLAGQWSPLAVLFAGASVFIVVLCFAEVGSRFD